MEKTDLEKFIELYFTNEKFRNAYHDEVWKINQDKKAIKSTIKRLTCNCCGYSTEGRQWYNQDNGYGICSNCVEYLEIKKGYYSQDIIGYYGNEGFHYNVS